MFDSPSIIVGLEIGTSKICAVVGEVGEAGALNIIGVGQAKSNGVRKGEITDTARAEEDIRQAIAEAEQMANAEIRSVYLGVTGGHLGGLTNRGVHPVPSAGREMDQHDVDSVVQNAKAVGLPATNTVVHTVRQHFHVDGQDGILNPIGMLGALLEVDVHIIHGVTNRLQNTIRLVKGLQLEVEAIAFNGLASSMAVLSPEQKELGALVIDLGAGTTEYVAYANGVIRHSGVLAVGGDHVTNDLAIGLKVPLSRAEQLKIEHGAAWLDDSVKGRTVALPASVGIPERSVNLEHLQRIMSLRLEEIFELVSAALRKDGLREDYLRAGVFLCGGGARIPRITRLAEDVLGLPAALSGANSISGLKAALDQPEFSTAIGLVKFGSIQQRRHEGRNSLTRTVANTINQLLGRR